MKRCICSVFCQVMATICTYITSSQSILRPSGVKVLSLELLHCVFHAIIVNNIMYAISAWYGFLNKGFLKCHKEISLCQSVSTSIARVSSFSDVSVLGFFDLLEEVKCRYSFQATYIFNVDGTSCMTVHSNRHKARWCYQAQNEDRWLQCVVQSVLQVTGTYVRLSTNVLQR